MSFYIYDIIFLVLFTLGVVWFLYTRKHNLKREGIMYLYRTQVGIRFIEYVGTKYKKTISVFGFLGIVAGYLLMGLMVYMLYKIIYLYLFVPELVRAIKVPPFLPLVPYIPEAFNIDFLPPFYFTYWIVSIAVIALFHEFAHGIVARRYNIKILTTGFGFLGPLLAAFVEPDEKQMEEKPKYQQLAVLSAGVFTNFILAIIFLLLLSVFFVVSYSPAGALFTTYSPGVVEIAGVSMIGGMVVEDNSREGIIRLIDNNELVDDVVLGSNGNSINYTKIIANDKTYYTTLDKLELQLETHQEDLLLLFEDLPAINVGMRGVIIGINDVEIKDYEDLTLAMSGFGVGDEILVKTNYNGEILEYNFELGSNFEGRAVMGVGYDPDRRLISGVTDMFNFFKKEGTNYVPKYDAEFIIFIYNLIWWLALINLSVAIFNMVPAAIFDGGRFFYLTVWGLTGSEKFARFAFKASSYLSLFALIALIFGYGMAYGWFSWLGL